MKPETRDLMTPRSRMLAKYLREDARYAILDGETAEDAAVRREQDCLALEGRLMEQGVHYEAAKEIAEKETELFPPDADQMKAEAEIAEMDREEAEEEAGEIWEASALRNPVLPSKRRQPQPT